MHPETLEEMARHRQRELRESSRSTAVESAWSISRRRVIAPLGDALVAFGLRLARPKITTATTRYVPSSW